VLVDANVLLYSVDEESPFHAAARDWMTDALNGPRRVGIPWMSLAAFVQPLTPAEAWEFVEGWLDAPATWTPAPGRSHRAILGRLVRDLDLRANLVSDAVLAAICVEHGLEIVSADSDFARFEEISWYNPVSSRSPA